MKAAAAQSKAPPRPAIIDENDGPCEVCSSQVRGTCNKCGRKDLHCGIHNDHTKHLDGAGFQSPKPSHYHLVPVEGVNGRRAHWAELCYNCYKGEYVEVYGINPFNE